MFLLGVSQIFGRNSFHVLIVCISSKWYLRMPYKSTYTRNVANHIISVSLRRCAKLCHFKHIFCQKYRRISCLNKIESLNCSIVFFFLGGGFKFFFPVVKYKFWKQMLFSVNLYMFLKISNKLIS